MRNRCEHREAAGILKCASAAVVCFCCSEDCFLLFETSLQEGLRALSFESSVCPAGGDLYVPPMDTNARGAASNLSRMATAKNCRFPKIWDEKKVLQECGKTILLYKRDDGTFDYEEALEFLLEKYGSEKPSKEAPKIIVIDDESEKTPTKKRKSTSKRKAETIEAKEDEEGSGKKKQKKSEMYTVEENRAVGEAIYEMAGIYFKNKDARKGGVFSKAAKAIRECAFQIQTMKEAMNLPGIGKGIATYMQEFFDTGVITKLEEMRAGMA